MATGTLATGNATITLQALGITRAQWDTLQANILSELSTLEAAGVTARVTQATYFENNPSLS